MSLINKTIALSLVAVCTQVTIMGQQRRATRSTTSETPFFVQAFDPSIASLPAHFRGHNAAEIYKRLAERKQASTKGEFETTEAYRQRMETKASQPLLGSMTLHSLLAFVVNDLESEYDADRQVLHAKAKLSSVREGVTLREKGMSLHWNIVNRSSSSYIGTNAFGARTRVESTASDFYEIAIENYQQFAIRYLRKSTQEVADDEAVYARLGINPETIYDHLKDTALSADLKMNAQFAMRAKENLRMLLVCRLAYPYIIEGTMYSKPTIDDPQEFFVNEYSVNTKLVEVWFFDSSTGQVYAKQQPTRSLPEVTVSEKTERPSPQMCRSSKPRILEKPEAQYTKEARQAQVTGTVVLSVLLGAKGEVADIQVRRGLSQGLTERAIEAAKNIRFIPAEANCQRVSFRMELE